ncbi:MAG: hypothetical protein ACHQAQ_09725 [Hyphomicrobiales bacterium]
MLGWTAAQGRYGRFAKAGKAYDVFHSGKVRFSNALPLTPSGHAAYPVPQLLMEPKHRPADPDRETLDPERVRVGRPTARRSASGNADANEQYEVLKNFVTLDGRIVKIRPSSRLRTAVRRGRAAEGQLFGYQHIEPAEDRRYVASIEAEDNILGEEQWEALLDAFDGKVLRLGRASGTAHGGGYRCVVAANASCALWPAGGVPAGAARVRVWALSDLALADALGAPCFAPTAEMLGLPGKDSEFCGSDSAITVRRYAPWNRHLGTRDVERQVIAAGSVLTFVYRNPIEVPCQGKGRVGSWQESGLGRMCTAPQLLEGEGGTHTPGARLRLPAEAAEPIIRAAGEGRARPEGEALPDGAQDLLRWLEAMRHIEQAGNGTHA